MVYLVPMCITRNRELIPSTVQRMRNIRLSSSCTIFSLSSKMESAKRSIKSVKVEGRALTTRCLLNQEKSDVNSVLQQFIFKVFVPGYWHAVALCLSSAKFHSQRKKKYLFYFFSFLECILYRLLCLLM